jgi:DTW domain-containing protein YfiP
MVAITQTEQLKTVEVESTIEKTLAVPISVLQQILDEDSSEPLEDWLMVTNQKFIIQMTRAQEDVKAGKGMPWKKVKEQLGIK